MHPIQVVVSNIQYNYWNISSKADYVEIMAGGNEWVGSALSGIDDAITTS